MSVKAIKLGVNIDHVATLRQARRASMPDVVEAAAAAVRGGADGITVHLREDRRHIQDADVAALVPFHRVNLEMAATPEMVAAASGCVGLPTPHSVCIVPEKRQELTTEGGLDVLSQRARLTDAVADLKAAGVVVSLFVAPDPWQIEAAARTGASHVELHTGAYAEAASMGAAMQRETELRALKKAATTALQMGLRVNAGHGLDYRNVRAILNLDGLEELNIGFAIVARAVFVGLEEAVREMKILIDASATPMAVNA